MLYQHTKQYIEVCLDDSSTSNPQTSIIQDMNLSEDKDFGLAKKQNHESFTNSNEIMPISFIKFHSCKNCQKLLSFIQNLQYYIQELKEEQKRLVEEMNDSLFSYQQLLSLSFLQINQKIKSLQPADKISGVYHKTSISIKQLRKDYEEQMKKFNLSYAKNQSSSGCLTPKRQNIYISSITQRSDNLSTTLNKKKSKVESKYQTESTFLKSTRSPVHRHISPFRSSQNRCENLVTQSPKRLSQIMESIKILKTKLKNDMKRQQ